MPESVRRVLEWLAHELEMSQGDWRLVARFKDGTLLRIDRAQEKIPASELDRQDVSEGPAT